MFRIRTKVNITHPKVSSHRAEVPLWWWAHLTKNMNYSSQSSQCNSILNFFQEASLGHRATILCIYYQKLSLLGVPFGSRGADLGTLIWIPNFNAVLWVDLMLQHLGSICKCEKSWNHLAVYWDSSPTYFSRFCMLFHPSLDPRLASPSSKIFQRAFPMLP